MNKETQAVEVITKIVDTFGNNAESIWADLIKQQFIDGCAAAIFTVVFAVVAWVLVKKGKGENSDKDNKLMWYLLAFIAVTGVVLCASEAVRSFATPQAEALKEILNSLNGQL